MKRGNLLLCFWLLSSFVFSGCIITGKVIDQTGAGVPGVTIALSGDTAMTTMTDGNGNYQFGSWAHLLSAGNYTLTPVGGASPAARNVTITQDGSAPPQPVYGVYFVSGENAPLLPFHVGDVFKNRITDSDGKTGDYNISLTGTTTIGSDSYFVADSSDGVAYIRSTKTGVFIMDEDGSRSWTIDADSPTISVTAPYGGPYLAIIMRRTFSSNEYCDNYLVPGIGIVGYMYHDTNEDYWERQELLEID
ncbi:MAG: carboxypeptidase-like regulatory domain-containing protein [Pseudomonadota bacterium]